MDYRNLPKIDLHCHLDGSVRPETILALAAEQKIALPSQDIDEISRLMIAPETCKNLEEYIQRFALPLSVMQTKEGLERISYEVFEDAALENVKYLEVRFGPQLHQQSGLGFDEIIESVVKGMQRAESDFDIKGNYILSILRTLPTDDIKAIIDVGAKYLHQGVVAFDLAGAEFVGFCQDFIDYARYAKEKGFRITIHAGEQGSGQNVHDAIRLLGAERIGHGIHIHSHQSAYELVKQNAIPLETCPSSNVQTKAVADFQSHPFKQFYADDIRVTINTDNRTVSNTTMTKEVQKVMEEFQLDRMDYEHIYRTSVTESFASDSIKQHLLRFLPLTP